MFLRGATLVYTFNEMLVDMPLLFFISLVMVVAGLAIVIAHNIWSGGALAIVVTLMGWLVLLKGVLLLVLPPDIATSFYFGTLRYRDFYYLYTFIPLAIGVFLTYGGFKHRKIS
jgi:hypothetical protein